MRGQNNLRIGYTYNLGSGLKRVTEPFGYDLNYAVDRIARLTGVTGDATADKAETTPGTSNIVLS
ncbi:MAG: hypothetical protein IPK58_11810 [Acidobacteria bacterium]|nr:hypothetical protein [Acidobacteriota bacterium]